MPEIPTRLQQPQAAPPVIELPRDFPRIPDEIIERFPTATDWQRKLDDFWRTSNQALQQAQTQTANQVNSTVVYSVDRFLIYANGVPTPMFDLDSTGVRLGGVLVVNTPYRKVYIGGGVWADAGTPFYIDADGFFSLGDSLTWDPDTDTLTITGVINADSGTIGGFDIGTNYIRDAANSFGLSSVVTGGDDVRFWAGDTFANRASAPFYVTESGKFRTVNIGVGGNPIASVAIAIRGGGDLTGSTMRGVQNIYEITSATTVSYRSFESAPSTEASAFTLANLSHFFAIGATIGLGSSITNQMGFNVASSLTGATNNYGFRGQIAAGANRYNLYMDGTADNFLAGDLFIQKSIPALRLYGTEGSAKNVVVYENAGIFRVAENGVGDWLQVSGTTSVFVGSISTATPTAGASGAWKLGKYTAGAAAQAGKARVNIDGTDYDLLTA